MWETALCTFCSIFLNNALLSHKKNEILPFATTRVDLEDIMLSEVSQRKTNTIRYHLHVESKKYNKIGTSLLVQWIRLCLPMARGAGLIPGQGLRSHMPLSQKTKTKKTETILKNTTK